MAQGILPARKWKNGRKAVSRAADQVKAHQEAMERVEMATVLAQPHRMGSRSQLRENALGRFVEDNRLRRELYDAGRAYGALKSKWRAAKGAPMPDRLGGSGADIAIIDLSLGEDSGLELLHALKALNIPGLVYSMYEDPETIALAFDSGAGGYITKREMAEVLLLGVQEVRDGRRFISPRAAQSLAMRAVKGNGAREAELSERERQILRMLGQGDSAADIAREFIISTRTVETYYSRLMEKLGLVGMKELRKFAISTRN